MRVAEPNLDWMSIYWVGGGQAALDEVKSYPKFNGRPVRYEVATPPTNGESHAFLISGEKTTALVCPYSGFEDVVSNLSGEILLAREAKGWNQDRVLECLAAHESLGQLGMQVVAMLKGEPVSAVLQETARRTGGGGRKGKPMSEELLKPVKSAGKRGKLLKAIMDDGGASDLQHLERVMKANRNSVLSFLFMLWKDHGIGYSLTGGSVMVHIPTTNPFVK